jgi:Bacterial dnaA protein helix-turn-helix/GcrA cell cycle regulator
MKWTDYKVGRLHALAAEGYSAYQISRIIGATKGSVIGKCDRLGIVLSGGINTTIPIAVIPPPIEGERETGKHILALVATAYGLKADDIQGPSRNLRCVYPRHHAAYEIRRRTSLSTTQIGRIMGGRDHTTAINSIRQHEKRMAEAGL